MSSDAPPPFVFRTDAVRGMPVILREVLTDRGWHEYDEEVSPEQQPPFNLFWRTNRFTSSEIRSAVYPCARINHCPKSSEITKKDHLFRHIRRMRVVHGTCYDFVPQTFALPTDYVKFCQHFAGERERWENAQVEVKREAGARLRRRQKAAESGHPPDPDDEDPPLDPVADLPPTYICKPSDLSRGRKIFVFRDIAQLTYDCSSVVQRYIDRPLLIHGHKVDFRVYVLVTCFQPLRVYIYDDLLARFSVEKYDLTSVDNIFSHLTNYSINKNSKIFDDYKAGIGTGCKWHGAQIKAYFASCGIDWAVMWARVEALVSYTLLSIAPLVPQVAQCFELYGFDVMFDQDFKPWLIEVNFSPALAVESETDDIVKRGLMGDMIDTLNIPPFPAGARGSAAAVAGGGRDDADGDDGDDDGDAGGQPASRPQQQPHRSAAQRLATAAVGVTTTKRVVNSGNVRSTSRVAVPRGASAPAPAVGSSRRPTSATAAKAVPPAAGGGGGGALGIQFIDAPRGKFRWCFPFSPETEKLAALIGRTGDTHVEQVIRQCISEVKKKEAKCVAQMRDYADIYNEKSGGGTARKSSSKKTSAAAPPATAAEGAAPSRPSGSAKSAGASRDPTDVVARLAPDAGRHPPHVGKRRAAGPAAQLQMLPPDSADLEKLFAAMREEARHMAL